MTKTVASIMCLSFLTATIGIGLAGIGVTICSLLEEIRDILKERNENILRGELPTDGKQRTGDAVQR